MVDGLQIRLLGELALTRGGRALALPPSKKTRALLGYLVLTGRAHRRERLCELLWDVADDPRAALRWSLTKLRELVDEPGVRRLVADREHVRLALTDVAVDVLSVRPLLGRELGELPTARLDEALACFRGELLEGLELPDFHAYHAHCLGEREALRTLHAQLVRELLRRAGGASERALSLARRLVDLDPASEGARAQFTELLHASGRAREAALESDKSRRLLAIERVPDAEPAAREQAADARGRDGQRGVPPRKSQQPAPLVGREQALATACASLRVEAKQPASGLSVLLVSGEAGLGKSALFAQLVAHARPHVAMLHRAGAHELDPGFPYAPLQGLLHELGLLPGESAPLPAREEADSARARLFHKLVRALGERLATGARGLLALEDLHWLDEASVLLLSHLVRSGSGLPLSVLLTARPGELADNAPARRLVRMLRAEELLEELALEPLSREQTRTLVRSAWGEVAPDEADAIFAQSRGNPLFALELARAGGSPRVDVPASITRVVRERMESLAPEPLELLRWASVLGTTFRVAGLEPLLSLEPVALVGTLEQLERLGWLRFEAVDAAGDDARFSHDLVRRAIYDGLSEPRRRLMHGRVARLLAAQPSADGALASELARHAVLAGDAAMAVRACLSAAQRCLRLCADGDALALARRGLAHVAALALPDRCVLEIELREVMQRVHAPSEREELYARLAVLATQALALSEVAHARRAFHGQAVLRWERGHTSDAQRFSREAERCSRLGGPRDRLRGLSDAARCLVSIERDLADAHAFVLEAEALVAAGEHEVAGFALAQGMLALYAGEYVRARAALERAADLAASEGDPLLALFVSEHQFELAFVEGRWEEAESIARRMSADAERLREGSERPFAQALLALAHLAREAPDAEVALAEAIAGLAQADAKQRTAYVLTRGAELVLARGQLTLARERAHEALRLAEQLETKTEIALAWAVLTEVAVREGAADHVERGRAALRALATGTLSARARGALARALDTGAPERKTGGKHGARDRRARLR